MIIFTSIFPAYVLSGFKKWKKALEQFSSYEKSNCHKTAVTTCMYMKTDHLKHSCVVIRHHSKRNHEYVFEKPRACHWMICSCWQSTALRGHDDSEGNLHQQLKYKAEEDPCLRKWLSCRKDFYTSAQIVNEFLNLLSNSVIRDITYNIRLLTQFQFSVMMDGTLDVSGRTNKKHFVYYM